MSTLPYFRWYPGDAIGDQKYSALSDMELGFYHRCLNFSWLNGGLPSELDELAATMHVTRKYLDRVWPKVGRCFQLNECVHPKYINPRQEKERSYALSKSEKASTSVSKRKDRTINERSTNVGTNDVLRAGARADTESESDIASAVEVGVLPFSIPPKSYALDEAFMRFMGEVEATGAGLIDVDYEDAHGVWLNEMDMAERLYAISSFQDKRAAGMYSDPAMVMRPAKWLKRKEFNRRTIKARDSPPQPNGTVYVRT